MNISKVGQSNTVAITNSTPHSIVGELQKQKMQLTKQIETVKGSNEDAKAKAEKIKNINAQIEELNKQIQQAQIDEKQKKIEEIQEKNAEKAAEENAKKSDGTQTEGIMLSASLNNILVAKNVHADVKNLSGVRTKLLREVAVAEGQIKYGTGSTIYQMGVIEENGSKIAQVEGRMATKMGEVNKKLTKSIKQGINEAEKERANKQDQVKEKEESDKNVNNKDEDQVKQVTTPTDTGNVIAIDKNDTDKNEIDKVVEKKVKNTKSIDILA